MIKSIQAVTAQGVGACYEIGQVPSGFDAPVASIKDSGIEWSDHIDWFYSVNDESGNVMAELINCPVEIKYFRAEGSK